MSDWRARLAAMVVAPLPASTSTGSVMPASGVPLSSHPGARPQTLGLVASDGVVMAAAGVLAAGLRRASASHAVLVCAWRPGTQAVPAPAPALPGAARVAAGLRAAGIEARPVGALCVVVLPDDAGAAADLARRVLRDAPQPAVVAVSRRDPQVDDLLAAADHVHFASGSEDRLLAALALEDLRRLGPPVATVVLPASIVGRRCATLGLAS